MGDEILNENTIEQAALTWLEELGYRKVFGPDIAHDGPNPERESYQDVILRGELEFALKRINPDREADALEEAFRKIVNPSSPSLLQNNRTFHNYISHGVEVEARKQSGASDSGPVKLIDFENPENNYFVAVNQFTIIEKKANRRPDVLVFVNGLPIGVIELKNLAAEGATVENAYNQLQTYKTEIPSLFNFNELLIASDGISSFVGTLTSDRERFMPWKCIDSEVLAPKTMLSLEVLIKGVFEKSRLLKLLRSFVVFEDDGEGKVIKKLAGYHQFHAVQSALQSTLKASASGGDRRAGVVWHTQGSGKSLTMTFFAGALVLEPKMENPTLLILTDRNDLDDQLFGTFSHCSDLLRQKPKQAGNRDQLKEFLAVDSGGVVFTTIQKFLPQGKGESFPALSKRTNIVVIADEAHRSQYDFIDGFAKHMRDALPNATYIGFTGTPIELSDKNTQAVFGNYVSVYDIQRAVEDKATVPIYYESRLAKLELKSTEVPTLDVGFEEVTEDEEEGRRDKLRTKWAQLESIVGAEPRLSLIAKDIVDHFEKRQEAMDGGKAMIVGMSRRICIDLYNSIIKLRPKWHSTDDKSGSIKVVMTGSASDPQSFQPHIRNKTRREDLANRFRDSSDGFQLAIVRDMWLTGFDAPCMHTLYVDKPMRGHGLMQAIARVNRVFKNKKGGLVVDYLGIADQLKEALANYTESGGTGKTAIDQSEAVAVMIEKYEIVCGLMHGFDWSAWSNGSAQQKIGALPEAQEHILKQQDGKERFLKSVTELAQAFSLSVPNERALTIRDDIAFFQTLRIVLSKRTGMTGKSTEEIEFALKQLVSKAISSDGIIDVFSAAGLKKPDISILSDEFLAEVKSMPHRNLAVELLERLLGDEIKTRSKKNLVQAKSFSELLERALKKYQNRAIETAQVIEELIQLARDMKAADKRGDDLKLSTDEIAFYDALEVNDSAVKVLGDENLRIIAKELVDTVKKNVTIDWNVRESARAKLRVMVKRILKKYGYPPDKQEHATQVVLQQAELLCRDWVV
jgi:type I restriction enzyme R subunit